MKGKIYFGLLIALMLLSPSANAGTKEELARLQADVNDLRNQIQELERTFSVRVDGLKSLLEQLNDQVASSNLVLERVSKAMEMQASGAQSSDQILLQEIRSLSQKMDEMGTRVSAMAQQLNELQVQSQSFRQTSSFGGGLSPSDLLDQAEGDFVEGNLDLAMQGFSAYIDNYPGGEKAVAALNRIGDIYEYQGMEPEAMAAYTRAIDEYPDREGVASALFKRANLELNMGEKDKATEDFKSIVVDFPDTDESELAKEKLKELGARIPRPARNTRR
jgi:TolA-binding protein